jgi:uncharacterized membrane protein
LSFTPLAANSRWSKEQPAMFQLVVVVLVVVAIVVVVIVVVVVVACHGSGCKPKVEQGAANNFKTKPCCQTANDASGGKLKVEKGAARRVNSMLKIKS